MNVCTRWNVILQHMIYGIQLQQPVIIMIACTRTMYYCARLASYCETLPLGKCVREHKLVRILHVNTCLE